MSKKTHTKKKTGRATHFLVRHKPSGPPSPARRSRRRPGRLGDKRRSSGGVRRSALAPAGGSLVVFAIAAFAVRPARDACLEAFAVLLEAGRLLAVATGVVCAFAAYALFELADEGGWVALDRALDGPLLSFC